MARKFNVLLVAATAVILVFVVRDAVKIARMTPEHLRLTRTVGALTVDDSSKLNLIAIPVDDPMTFQWRVRVPAAYDARMQVSSRSGTSRSDIKSATPEDRILQLRFRMDGDQLWLRKRSNGGATADTFSSITTSRVLAENWSQLQIQQLGDGGAVALDPSDVAKLLVIDMPPEVAERLPDSAFASRSVENPLRLLEMTLIPANANPEAVKSLTQFEPVHRPDPFGSASSSPKPSTEAKPPDPFSEGKPNPFGGHKTAEPFRSPTPSVQSTDSDDSDDDPFNTP